MKTLEQIKNIVLKFGEVGTTYIFKNVKDVQVYRTEDQEEAIEYIDESANRNFALCIYRKNGSSKTLSRELYYTKQEQARNTVGGSRNRQDEYIINDLQKKNDKLEKKNDKLEDKIEKLKEKGSEQKEKLSLIEREHQLELDGLKTSHSTSLAGIMDDPDKLTGIANLISSFSGMVNSSPTVPVQDSLFEEVGEPKNISGNPQHQAIHAALSSFLVNSGDDESALQSMLYLIRSGEVNPNLIKQVSRFVEKKALEEAG